MGKIIPICFFKKHNSQVFPFTQLTFQQFWFVFKSFCNLYLFVISCACFRYPFVLSKSSMCSVGAPHTWPMALGALMWLIDNVKVKKIVSKQTDAWSCYWSFWKLIVLFWLSDPAGFEGSEDVYLWVLCRQSWHWWRNWVSQGVVINTIHINNISMHLNMLFSQYKHWNSNIFCLFILCVCSLYSSSRTTQLRHTSSTCTIMTRMKKKMKLSLLNSVSVAHLFRSSYFLFSEYCIFHCVVITLNLFGFFFLCPPKESCTMLMKLCLAQWKRNTELPLRSWSNWRKWANR